MPPGGMSKSLRQLLVPSLGFLSFYVFVLSYSDLLVLFYLTFSYPLGACLFSVRDRKEVDLDVRGWGGEHEGQGTHETPWVGEIQ